MDEIFPTSIIKFNDNQLVKVRSTFGYNTVDKIKQDIDLFEDWIIKQNHFIVKDFGRNFLERYLIYNKGSLEKAKKRLDKLCTLRNLLPEILQNFNVKNQFNHVFNCLYFFIVPIPTPDNYRVVITAARGFDEKFDLYQYYKYIAVTLEYLLSHDYNAGYEVIIDTRNITWPLVAKFNPATIHKGTTLFVEAMGMRVKYVHCLTGSKFFDVILTLFKQGFTEKLRNRIVIHDSIESLHKFISKEILPAEYGGNGYTSKEIHDGLTDSRMEWQLKDSFLPLWFGTLKIFHEMQVPRTVKINEHLDSLPDQLFKELCTDSHIERVKYMEKAATDESRRLSSKFNEEYSGMPGSFKVLSVD